ncbi:hypothetical protein N7533_012875 [Penicillium manginii]|jgi:hypothetical protein|uniref:uncharacterized protein n=1 Tax=Penicillium manginii TaxID=203109 RepID=UPI002549500E|nr:uncharacterized protein N7533_012875 [Penicillium manginii]KAJ5740091.1 hypothetical protein N7533_012875 [Penicillium manginii]
MAAVDVPRPNGDFVHPDRQKIRVRPQHRNHAIRTPRSPKPRLLWMRWQRIRRRPSGLRGITEDAGDSPSAKTMRFIHFVDQFMVEQWFWGFDSVVALVDVSH